MDAPLDCQDGLSQIRELVAVHEFIKRIKRSTAAHQTSVDG
jgi:hypothetical protein